MPRPVRRLPRRRALLALAGLFAVAAVAAGWLTWDAATRARDARAAVYAAKAELEQARVTVQALAGLDAGALPSAAEIETALGQIRAAREHLQAADGRLGYLPRLLPAADLLPPADGAAEVPALIDVGLAVTESADQLLTAVLPLLQESAPGDERSLAERVRAVFVEEGDALDAALARLDATCPEVARLRARAWGGWLDAAPGALELLDGALADVPRAREAFAALRTGIDPLFGFDRPKTYLVAGLNESEIRPTGGFMGTVGIVTVDRGHITTSEFERVYAFERVAEVQPAPPSDLIKYMAAGYQQLRDANWWPDFPTSAERTLELFELNQGYRPDGVIALNTLFTDRLVQVFAPLDLPEYDEVLTAENWRGVMEHTLLAGRAQLGEMPVQVGAEGADAAVSAEGSYLHPLMEELLRRSQSASAAQLPALLAAVTAGTAGRDLQAYMADPVAQAMLDRFGVTGRLAPLSEAERAAGVHRIAVVDSNVSWSKAGPGIHRDTTVLLGEGGVVSIHVRWENRVDELDPAVYPRAAGGGEIYQPASWVPGVGGQFEAIPGVFGNYVRVYLPPGVEDLWWQGNTGESHVIRDQDFTVVGGLVPVRPGETGQFVVSYRVTDATQVIEIWKQGGIEHDALRVLENVDGMQRGLFQGGFTTDVRVLAEPSLAAD